MPQLRAGLGEVDSSLTKITSIIDEASNLNQKVEGSIGEIKQQWQTQGGTFISTQLESFQKMTLSKFVTDLNEYLGQLLQVAENLHRIDEQGL